MNCLYLQIMKHFVIFYKNELGGKLKIMLSTSNFIKDNCTGLEFVLRSNKNRGPTQNLKKNQSKWIIKKNTMKRDC